MLNLAPRSLCSQPLSPPSSSCYKLVFSHLMTRFPWLPTNMQQSVIPRRPQDKTSNKTGPWHNENDLDPMTRMELSGQLGLKSKPGAQLPSWAWQGQSSATVCRMASPYSELGDTPSAPCDFLLWSLSSVFSEKELSLGDMLKTTQLLGTGRARV